MDKLIVERRPEHVAVVRLNRPERMNALDDDLLCHLLPSAVAELDEDPEVHVIVITGQGPAFCGGADLEGCSAFDAIGDAKASEDFIRWTCELPVKLRTMRTPSIAAVNGPAVGAGFGLALACDWRFVGTAAFFTSPFIEMGLVPDYGLSYFLPRLVGIQAALDIMVTARRVGAREALELGIAWRVGDDPVGDALAYAEQLARRPVRAVQVTRRALYDSEGRDVVSEILQDEARTQAIAMNGEEFRSLFAAYRRGIGSRG